MIEMLSPIELTQYYIQVRLKCLDVVKVRFWFWIRKISVTFELGILVMFSLNLYLKSSTCKLSYTIKLALYCTRQHTKREKGRVNVKDDYRGDSKRSLKRETIFIASK